MRSSHRRESGTNLARVKDYNEVVVLDLVRGRGELTRPAIAEATGLSLQTVSNIARRLLEAGVLRERAVATAGRTQRRLRLNAEAAYALGIQLDRAAVSVGVVNLAGEIKARADFSAEGEPAEVISRMAASAERLMDESGVRRERVLGAGVGAPGPLDLGSGRLLTPLCFTGWDGFPLREAVSDALGMRVLMDNDATAAALGEQWRGMGRSASSYVYLYLGRGFGAGMVLGGQAHRGLRGNAGEVSHIPVEPGGPRCECGASGCLGLYVTPAGLLREARRAVLEAPAGDAPPWPETLAEVLDRDVPLFADVVARAGERLARVVVEVTRLLDPELVILGGPLIEGAGRRFREAIALRLALLDTPGAPAPRVELSRIGSDAAVVGAATLVLHDLYAPTMGKLSLAESPSPERQEGAVSPPAKGGAEP
jgi:predicted NBD/HSP70 family sugar kinase